MRGKKFDTRAVVLLAFGLTAVLLIMWQLRLSTPKPPAEITAASPAARVMNFFNSRNGEDLSTGFIVIQ